MKTGDQSQLYSGSTIHQRMERMAELVRLAGSPSLPGAAKAGRNALTRFVDRVLLLVRRRAPAGALVGSMDRRRGDVPLRSGGRPNVAAGQRGARRVAEAPERSVLAVWHGCAPSLLTAIAKRRPRQPMVILITTSPRGDVLDVLCRLLGFRVIRGDSEHHGWPSLARVAEAVAGGACAIITPDGGAARGVVRAGVVALAAAAGVPLMRGRRGLPARNRRAAQMGSGAQSGAVRAHRHLGRRAAG